LLIGAVYLVFRNLDLIPDWGLQRFFYFGILGLLMAMSILLSRRFGTTSRSLERELRTTQELLAANTQLRQSGALDQIRAAAADTRKSTKINQAISALWKGLNACDIRVEALYVAVV
jgi:hypothetical protein